MITKAHQASIGALQHAAELLQAHQLVIDAWYDTWTKEQRLKAAELLRRRRLDASTDEPKAK
jgi:hypothetical protein